MERSRLKISPKIIVVLAAVLLLIIGITAWMNASSTEVSDGTQLTIYLDGEEITSYSLEELMKIGNDSTYAEFSSGKSADEKGIWSGIWLSKLLKDAGLKDDQYKTIILSAGDGYSTAAAADETDVCLVAWEKNGETLGYYTKGGTGPLRCIFTEEAFGMRCIDYLVKIDCRP